MRKLKIKYQRLVIQPDSQSNLQVSDVTASSDTIANPDSHNIKSNIPLTYSQKLHQSPPRGKSEEFEETLEAYSLERIKRLLDKLFELS